MAGAALLADAFPSYQPISEVYIWCRGIFECHCFTLLMCASESFVCFYEIDLIIICV